MADLGSDFSAIADIDANLTRVTGRTAHLQLVARMLIQPNGGIHYDTARGHDTRKYLSAAITGTPSKGPIEEQALLDERTLGANATVVFNEATRDLKIRLDVVDDDGPFSMVVDPKELSAALLNE